MGIEDGKNNGEPQGLEDFGGEALVYWLERAEVGEVIDWFNQLPEEQLPERLRGVSLDWNSLARAIKVDNVYTQAEIEELLELGVIAEGQEDWYQTDDQGRVKRAACIDWENEEGPRVDYVSQLYYFPLVRRVGDESVAGVGVCEVRYGDIGIECQVYVMDAGEREQPELLASHKRRAFRDGLVVRELFEKAEVALRRGVEVRGGWCLDDWSFEQGRLGRLKKRLLVYESEGGKVNVAIEPRNGRNELVVFRYTNGSEDKLAVEVYGGVEMEIGSVELAEYIDGSVAERKPVILRVLMVEDEESLECVSFECGSYQLELDCELGMIGYGNGLLIVVGYVPESIGKRLGGRPGIDMRNLNGGGIRLIQGTERGGDDGAWMEPLDVDTIWEEIAGLEERLDNEDLDWEVALVISLSWGELVDWSVMPGYGSRPEG